jgi:uncharacterized lipoprotein YmbA
MKKRLMLVALVSAVLLSGCAVAPDTYYTLAAGMQAADKVVPAPDAEPIFIELAPVAVPERLARPQMVIRKAGKGDERSAEVELLEQHRWASSFESELRDALAGGIANRLGAIDTTKGGHQPGQNAWRIAVQLRQFDAVENAQIDAALSWTVRRADGARSFACQWAGREPVAAGIAALAQGAQRITGSAAQAIAGHVATLNALNEDGNAGAPCRQ